MGFPTVNLELPNDLIMGDGIYAVKVKIEDKNFNGAMHYGPIPTFNEIDKTLEVFLIDTKDEDIPKSESFEIEIIKFLRPVMSFYTKKELTAQIQKDVEETKKILGVS